MPTAAVGGTSLYYDELGQGPVCLVMHGGLGFDHTCFRPALDRLGDRLRLVYYDHRGNGRSGRPPLETLTMERLADDADALAAHVGADRVVVLGHSYGTFVAQELALRHPGRVAGLILVGATPGQLGASESPDDEQGSPPPPELQALLRASPATDEEFAAVVRALAPFYVRGIEPAALEPVLAKTILRAGAMRRSMEVLATWSAVDRLGTVACPVLLLVGRHDVFCSPPQSERIARRVPEAELVVFEESGHFPWLEEPDRFLAVVRGWLDRAAVGAGGERADRGRA
jgi:proline iminopeptidase